VFKELLLAALSRPYEVPSGKDETAMAELWQAFLGVERIGRDDHFFELGGHSLIATRVLARIQREYNVQLSLRDMFDAPTLKDFAALVTAAKQGAVAEASSVECLGLQEAPLSYSQEMLYLEDQIYPSMLCYNVAESYRITGELDLRAMEGALMELVRRQASLRTRFLRQGEEVMQYVEPPGSVVPFPVIDLTDCCDDNERYARARDLQMQLACEYFSLETGPLLRSMLIRCAERDYRLLLVVHHIATDGWGQGILRRDIGTLYRSFGGASPLPELTVQYTDYATWQRDRLNDARLGKSLAYWVRQLEGAHANVSFPADRPRPPIRSFRGAREAVELNSGLSRRLKQFCGRCGVTPFMLLLTVLKTLLYRITAQTDIVVGTAFSDRSVVETEQLVGNMTNTVVLRNDLAGRPPFFELLGRVANSTLDAHEYRDVPFQKLVQYVGVDRGLNQNPFFQVMFVLENTPNDLLDLGKDLNVEPEWFDIGTCMEDFGITLTEQGDLFVGHVEYNVDLYDPSSIRTFMDSYLVLLNEAITHPDRSIDELTLLPPIQYQRLMAWGTGVQDAWEDALVTARFEREVHRRGSETAVVTDGGSITYGQLNARANQLARHLTAMDVGPEVAVGVLLERNVDLYVAMLGIMKAGGVYVPLDPLYPLERLRHMASDACLHVLLTGEKTRDLAVEGLWEVFDMQEQCDVLAAHSVVDVPSRLSGENLAYIMYTSGSTGQPKGVCISHRALANQLHWVVQAFALNTSDRFLHKASICFDSSMEEILAPLICGAQLIAARPHGEYEVAYLAELIERQAVTCIDLAPSLLDALMDMSSPQAWRSIRLVISGGEVLKPELAARFAAKYPAILLNTYGPTEATIQAAWTNELGGNERLAIGRPVANTQLYVLDASMHPVPVGAHGQLYIGGAGIARGYLHRAAATAEKFVPNPFGRCGERLYRTGDQVRWRENGQLEFIGRVDHQVKLRGYRIELSEIEQAIEAHPHVGNAVVVLREDQPGLPQLAAYVVADTSISFPDLRDSLLNRLPRHMVPALWTRLAQLPLNVNGKIDRKRLPKPEGGVASSDVVAPRTKLEAEICGIFQDLMQWERVSIHDNFFDLGGHSLSATRVASRLSTMVGQSLPARLLFEAPTVAHLAEATERHLAIADRASMAPAAVTQSLGTEQLLASVEALSEDEIELLLEQLSQGPSP
jgi:amino acid adenylation domain-containing protein